MHPQTPTEADEDEELRRVMEASLAETRGPGPAAASAGANGAAGGERAGRGGRSFGKQCDCGGACLSARMPRRRRCGQSQHHGCSRRLRLSSNLPCPLFFCTPLHPPHTIHAPAQAATMRIWRRLWPAASATTRPGSAAPASSTAQVRLVLGGGGWEDWVEWHALCCAAMGAHALQLSAHAL